MISEPLVVFYFCIATALPPGPKGPEMEARCYNGPFGPMPVESCEYEMASFRKSLQELSNTNMSVHCRPAGEPIPKSRPADGESDRRR